MLINILLNYINADNSFFKLIYSVKLVEFKYFNFYIKFNLANNFIYLFKLFIYLLYFLLKN